MTTTEEKIEAIVESMASWDHEELLRWAQDARAGMLRGVCPDVVDEEYIEACTPDDSQDCEHEPDWPSVAFATGMDDVLDVRCRRCGASGSALVPSDISW